MFSERESHTPSISCRSRTCRGSTRSTTSSHGVAKVAGRSEARRGARAPTRNRRKSARRAEGRREARQGGSRRRSPPTASTLNKKAAQGKIDPLIGREAEVDRTNQILCRRFKNNTALLSGDPGVGKTAIAEGLRADRQGGGAEVLRAR
jgi:ATP-dependent Clp protease ATP-binding subunit ClpA